MKLVYFLPLLLIFLVPQAFATNSLEDEHLFAQSATLSLDLQFGQDDIKYGMSKNFVTNTLEDITLKLYDDEIPLSDAEVKVSPSGEHFRIFSVTDGIIIYGHYNEDLKNYKINIYFTGQNGMVKHTVNTAAELQDDKVIEKQAEEPKAKYIPDLIITTDHDFKTYWNDNFDIEVRSYDKRSNANPELNPFDGKINDANVTAIISIDGDTVATLSGTTQNGQWKGQHYFIENISSPGEYIVDVIVSNLGKTASYTSSMFVIGTVSDIGGSSGPVAFAGVDRTVTHAALVNLDGGGSSDANGPIVSYSWTQLSGPAVVLNNPNTATPNFNTVGAADTYVFQLVVTNNNGKTGSDTITVTT